MAQVSINQTDRQSQLPIDGDGVCMQCKQTPKDDDILTCVTCVAPWHVACLLSKPETLASELQFECPDCNGTGIDVGAAPAPAPGSGGDLISKIRAIEADESLTEMDKARRRQELLSGKADDGDDDGQKDEYDVLSVLHENFKCCFCMQLPERPVTTPCGHNFCLKCFGKWISQGKRTCAKCRSIIPPSMAGRPRINLALVDSIRMAKMSRSIASGAPLKVYHFIQNQNRPDKAYASERAKLPGNANASSGRIFVTVPEDHFGPIPAENDPERMLGVLVGECWEDRLTCRQWGVHRPHITGIAGQSKYGAQSVVLSGGYEDDEDHGEWFLYTGSGGRDLSGNKRTNKEQSFDQNFTKANEALKVSCMKGYPVRVVRSCNEKRSSYSPEEGYRYDGIYRVEKCWRKVGKQGFKVCRYLFVRCDNEPAPWTSDEHGDRPRPLPPISELEEAVDVTDRKESPSWDFNEEEATWKWKKPPPHSKRKVVECNPEDREKTREAIRKAQYTSAKEKLLKGFTCLLCREVLTLPLTTPCAHNFCKHCLENAFAGQSFTRERTCNNGRKLRSQKNILQCPTCAYDISEFLKNPQVNREILSVIEKLQNAINKDKNKMDSSAQVEVNTSSEVSDALPRSSKTDSNDSAEGSNLRASKRKASDASLSTDQTTTNKKKKNDMEGGVSKTDSLTVNGGGQEGSPKAAMNANNSEPEEATKDGNDSPSSPLQLSPDDHVQ